MRNTALFFELLDILAVGFFIAVALPHRPWTQPNRFQVSTALLRRRDRGLGHVVRFGADITKQFCQRHGLELIIRSHECITHGFEVRHRITIKGGHRGERCWRGLLAGPSAPTPRSEVFVSFWSFMGGPGTRTRLEPNWVSNDTAWGRISMALKRQLVFGLNKGETTKWSRALRNTVSHHSASFRTLSICLMFYPKRTLSLMTAAIWRIFLHDLGLFTHFNTHLSASLGSFSTNHLEKGIWFLTALSF